MLVVDRNIMKKNLKTDFYTVCNNNNVDPDISQSLDRVVKVANAFLAIADNEARKGSLSVKWNPKTTFTQENADSVKTILTEGSSISNIITPYFKKNYDIDVKIEIGSQILNMFTINMLWKSNNPHLNPKPEFKVSSSELSAGHKSYFSSLFEDKSLSDITINIEGKTLCAHKIILAQSPKFKAQLTSDLKEKIKGVIDLQEVSYTTFSTFLHYLYKQDVTEGYFKDVHNCLEMLKYANREEYQPLVDLSISNLYDLINDENFLQISLVQKQLENKTLDTLCKWFLVKNPTFGENLDLSDLGMGDLISAYEIGKENKVETLIKVTSEAIKKIIALNDSFILLCKHIIEKKDIVLKNIFVQSLKDNREVYNAMIKGQKDDCKVYWKAYKNVTSDIDLQ